MFGHEIDGPRLGSHVFSGTIDPDVGGHDFVIGLRQSHVAIKHRFVGGCSLRVICRHFFSFFGDCYATFFLWVSG